jgi:hypothetical protein
MPFAIHQWIFTSGSHFWRFDHCASHQVAIATLNRYFVTCCWFPACTLPSSLLFRHTSNIYRRMLSAICCCPFAVRPAIIRLLPLIPLHQMSFVTRYWLMTVCILLLAFGPLVAIFSHTEFLFTAHRPGSAVRHLLPSCHHAVIKHYARHELHAQADHSTPPTIGPWSPSCLFRRLPFATL